MNSYIQDMLSHSQAMMQSIRLLSPDTKGNNPSFSKLPSFKSCQRSVSEAIKQCRLHNDANNLYRLAVNMHQLCHRFKQYNSKHPDYDIYQDAVYSQYAIFKWLSARVKLDYQALDITNFSAVSSKLTCCP